MKAALRRLHILEASKVVFSTKGSYYDTHVEEVIREAKIGKGTFYQYFRNKEHLFTQLLELFLDEWEEYVVADIDSITHEDVASYTRTAIERTFRFFFHNETICKIYLAGGVGFGSVFEPYIHKFEQRMLDYVKNLLHLGLEGGLYKKDLDVSLVANLYLGAILRIAYYKFVLSSEVKTESEIPSIAEKFYDVAMTGILA